MSSNTDEDLNVSIRFLVDPFEVSVSSKAKRSGLVDLLVGLFSTIRENQDKLGEAVSGVDLANIKPIAKPKAPTDDPLGRVAEKVGVSYEKLKEILRVENNLPVIVAKEKFGSPDKGALVLIYTFEFGLGKKPTHQQIGAAFKQSGFEPAFGKYTKNNLLRGGKITKAKDEISLLGPGILDAEAEIKRITASK